MTCNIPKAANDNEWDGRQVLAWPTAKRLATAGRHDDLAMLVGYKRLADLAYHDAANDNFCNPAPAPGEDDTRSASEVIEAIDMVPGKILPTIAEMHELSGVAWHDDRGFCPSVRPVRTKLVAVDVHNGVTRTRHELGGLAFVEGSRLLEYRTSPTAKPKKPTVLHAHHRNKKMSAASLVPSAFGQWTMEARIEARQELRLIHDSIPASSAMLLEIACGPTTAQEIGEAFRKREKTAQRFGVAVIDRALDHLRKVWNPQTALCA